MPAKNPKNASTHKAIDIKPRSVSSTSRPVIVSNRPLMRDPMLNAADGPEMEHDDLPLVNPNKSDKIINPPSEVDDSADNHSDEAAPTASELVKKLKSRKRTNDQDEAASDEAHGGENETIGEPSPDEAAPEPSDESEQDNQANTDAVTAAALDSAQEESLKSDKPADNPDNASGPNEDGDKPALGARSEADIEAEVRRARELDELVESGKYFVPVNAAKRRHDRQWLIVLIIIVLVLVALDLLFDAGVLKINGFNPPTNFFSR